MADKMMLNFRCPAELLDAIDAIGQDRYPSDTAKHGCDRTKTLLDIVRAGIEALSDGAVVLPVQEGTVRQSKTEAAMRYTPPSYDIKARFAAIEERLGKLRA
jgi:hypothetical protein